MKLEILLVFLILFSLNFGQNPHPNPRPDIFLNETNYIGFVNISLTSDIFYWYFPSLTDPDNDPLVFWLSGGPGCSSVLALFVENGPYIIQENLTLTKNIYSWSNNSNIVWVDQPVGTGYSQARVADMVRNESGVAQDFYTFLVEFFKQNPNLSGREVFITGESYAGHYIPAIASYILDNPNKNINLVGVAIGNGWVDPYHQYPQYANFAYANKLIGAPKFMLLKGLYYECQQLISAGFNWVIPTDECNIGTELILGNPSKPKFNIYDIRQPCSDPPLCYNFSLVDAFLAQPEVIEALGVQNRTWQECNMQVHMEMSSDWLWNLQTQVTQLLENKIQVLVYSGDQDFICNWFGGEAWTNDIQWKKKSEFNKLNYQPWNIQGKSYGEFKQIDNLIFLRVYNAGHMVPMDQPMASLNMLNRFFNQWVAALRQEKLNLIKEEQKQ